MKITAKIAFRWTNEEMKIYNSIITHVCKLLFKQKYISHKEYEQPASKTTCMKN